MLINLSNHPFIEWNEKQKKEALRLFENVEDIPFPPIDAACSEADIESLADGYSQKISALASAYPKLSVHLMGEMTFCFALLKQLQMLGIDCYASTTNRNVHLLNTGEKAVKFDFIQFRKYN